LTRVRVLAWPGMPSTEALREVARQLHAPLDLVTVSSNERLEQHLDEDEPFDLVFPSDYLVSRLRAADRLLELGPLPLERLEPWAVEAPYDPGCRHSVPFAYGTTGILQRRAAGAFPTWQSLFAPPAGVRVGMLDEVREAVGAALLAGGHSPNDCNDSALSAAGKLLLAQRPYVAAYDSDDFCAPVARGAVAAHQAWSGPAAHAVRQQPGLRYVVPREGAVLWTTTAAIPADAPQPERSKLMVRELMDPDLAALTTAHHGYATPNRAARALLPAALRNDPALFPDASTRQRCHVLCDLGPAESRLLDVWTTVRAA
jgi:spermidine/putrescine transport system substrate-binding protein